MPGSMISRRSALAGTASAGLTLPLLSACAGEEPDSAPGSTDSPTPRTDTEETSEPAGDGSLAAVDDIPVGGGLILPDVGVVITQPTAGEFKAFSASCTHTGCQVTGVSEQISCPCHGSTFSLETGEPTGGPAPSPLPEMSLTVENDRISLA